MSGVVMALIAAITISGEVTSPREYLASDGGVFRYRWYEPTAVEQGKCYPLVVLMRGAYCIEAGWVTGFIPLVFLYEEGDDSFFFRTDLKTHNEKEE